MIDAYFHSIYNKTAKWLILGGCGTLNYGQKTYSGNTEITPGHFWFGLNSAQLWARTMRGDGKMLHGILGYYGVAPGSTHRSRLKKNLERSTYSHNTYLDAWMIGNVTDNIVDSLRNCVEIFEDVFCAARRATLGATLSR